MKTLKRVNLEEAKRCWKGYKPTPGKRPYSKGSCMKEAKKLVGNQPEIDVYPPKKPDGKITRKDLKLLRKMGPRPKKAETVAEGSPAWQRKEGKNPSGGLNAKGVASYRAANPGSKLKTAVTTKPSKLKKGSKAAKRRKSFCARMGGMKKKLTGAKTKKNPNSRINKSLRKWNC